MSLDNQFKIHRNGNSYVLYDEAIIAEPTILLFDADYHTIPDSQQRCEKNGVQSGGIGRAKVVYFSLADKSYVLKHYFRGGAIASILKDHYLGFSVIRSRAFREFRLLKKMSELGLPVPVAAAAHIKKGLLSYQADLITEEIQQAKTLSDVLSEKALDGKVWQDIGACIKRFHQHGVYHADLNARNILLDDHGKIYLIDFDNSYIRLGSSSWKNSNLARLKRSLLKFDNNTDNFNIDETCWSALVAGYRPDA